MNVRTLCLVILHFEDATGYEIKKATAEGKYSYFIEASFGSIYPALAKLETDGCVTVRQELRAGKPARKVYTITEAGREELRKALGEPPAQDVFRSEFLLVSMFSEGLPREQVTAMIDQRIADKRTELKHLKEAHEAMEHAGARWALRYGIACTGASLAYLESSRDELEAIAGKTRDDGHKAAAE